MPPVGSLRSLFFFLFLSFLFQVCRQQISKICPSTTDRPPPKAPPRAASLTRTNIGTIAPAFAANIPLQLIDNSWGRVEAGAETAVGCWNQRGLNLQNRHVRRPAFALPAAPIILFSLRTASLTRWRSKRSRRRHRRSASLSQLAPCPPSPNSSSEDVEGFPKIIRVSGPLWAKIRRGWGDYAQPQFPQNPPF